MKMSEKVKTLRKRKGITLKILAKNVGCTDAYLSQIETGKAVPSITILQKLANALETNVRSILSDAKDVEPVVMKKNERIKILYPESNVSAELLVKKITEKQMEPLFKVIPAHSETHGVHRHEGEEFGYVLKGELVLKLADKSYVVKEGDSFYFRAVVPHSYKNTQDIDCETIWVVAPPVL